jgi:MFS family permease
LAVTFVMLNGLQFWGIAYFKRTFHLSGTATAGLAPVLGVGTFIGILGGGFLADRLLKRGLVRARVYIAIVGYMGAGIVFMAAFATTRLVLAATLLGVGSAFASLPSGPQYALLMDVTPASLRSQASAATNVLQAVSAIGPLIVGGLSTLLGNLRLALLCVSPFYLLGGVLFILSKRSYLEDVAAVVADAEASVGPDPADCEP